MADIHRLQVFLLAAETMNFTKTARRLHMTQPSVSQHIQALEQHFEIELFDRAGRYLALTEAGQRLVPLVQELIHHWVRIEETMETMKGEVAGHLLVSCSTAPGKYVLPQLLAQFHERYPKVKVSCHVGSQEHALQMLRDGKVQSALTGASHINADEIDCHRLVIDPINLIAPLDHPWASREIIESEELYEGHFIMHEEDSGTRDAVREALAGAGISESRLETLMTLGDSEAIALAVQEGLGVGFVSEIVVSALVARRIAVVNVRDIHITRDIFICHDVHRPETMAHAAFREFVLQYTEAEEVETHG